jgi:hypothetical protein
MSKRFSEMAKQTFSLLEDAGFRLVEIEHDLNRLRYETARTFVAIEWDCRAGELNVFVGLQPRKGKPEDAFSLMDLLRMEGVELDERKVPYQVAEESQLGPFLEKLAEYLRVHAQPALAGDRMFFRRLHAFRNAQARAYMQDMKLQQVRAEAEKAWRSRKLDKVILLYTSIQDFLTKSEKGKLDYARKHQTR